MVPGSMLPEDTTVPAYMRQQRVPGITGGVNDIVRALMAGYTKGNAARPAGDPGPVQAPVTMATNNPDIKPPPTLPILGGVRGPTPPSIVPTDIPDYLNPARPGQRLPWPPGPLGNQMMTPTPGVPYTGPGAMGPLMQPPPV